MIVNNRLVSTYVLFILHIPNFFIFFDISRLFDSSVSFFEIVTKVKKYSNTCSVQSLSRIQLFGHGLQHARLPCPAPTPKACSNSCPSNWWCHPTISSSVVPFSSHLQSFPTSGSFPIRWPKYWSFSFSISPSNECSGLISCRMDWLYLFTVQGTLKSLLQHHSSKTSIFQHSAFFIVQLSHPYMTTGKAIALIRWTFVGKVMSLLFNMLSM